MQSFQGPIIPICVSVHAVRLSVCVFVAAVEVPVPIFSLFRRLLDLCLQSIHMSTHEAILSPFFL